VAHGREELALAAGSGVGFVQGALHLGHVDAEADVETVGRAAVGQPQPAAVPQLHQLVGAVAAKALQPVLDPGLDRRAVGFHRHRTVLYLGTQDVLIAHADPVGIGHDGVQAAVLLVAKHQPLLGVEQRKRLTQRFDRGAKVAFALEHAPLRQRHRGQVGHGPDQPGDPVVVGLQVRHQPQPAAATAGEVDLDHSVDRGLERLQGHDGGGDGGVVAAKREVTGRLGRLDPVERVNAVEGQAFGRQVQRPGALVAEPAPDPGQTPGACQHAPAGRQGFFGPFVAGDVGADGGVALDQAIGPQLGRDEAVHPVEGAVLGAVADFTVPGPSLADGVPHLLPEFGRLGARIDDAVVLPQQLARAVTADRLEAWVDVQDGALAVGHRDDGVDVQRVAQGLQFAHRLARTLDLTPVVVDVGQVQSQDTAVEDMDLGPEPAGTAMRQSDANVGDRACRAGQVGQEGKPVARQRRR